MNDPIRCSRTERSWSKDETAGTEANKIAIASYKSFGWPLKVFHLTGCKVLVSPKVNKSRPLSSRSSYAT